MPSRFNCEILPSMSDQSWDRFSWSVSPISFFWAAMKPGSEKSVKLKKESDATKAEKLRIARAEQHVFALLTIILWNTVQTSGYKNPWLILSNLHQQKAFSCSRPSLIGLLEGNTCKVLPITLQLLLSMGSLPRWYEIMEVIPVVPS